MTLVIAIITWNLYLFFGDSKPLADCYNAIKRYVNYVERISNNYLTTWGRGDWVPVKSHSNKELTSSVYFYVDTQILAYAAKLFGKQEETDLAVGVPAVPHRRDGNNSQAATVDALPERHGTHFRNRVQHNLPKQRQPEKRH